MKSSPSVAPAGHDRWLDDRIDWAGFLAGADLIWKRLPATWYEGPFLGNGFLGSGIYTEPGANAVRFNVQHSEVQDHRALRRQGGDQGRPGQGRPRSGLLQHVRRRHLVRHRRVPSVCRPTPPA